MARHYRIGPATRSYDDASYVHLVESFDGNGLRPYAPAHLAVIQTPAGDDVSWVRRTRTDGDDWSGLDVPLGEEGEAYLVRVRINGVVLREEMSNGPHWHYPAAQKTADGVVGGYDVEVAQISASYGAGLFATLSVG